MHASYDGSGEQAAFVCAICAPQLTSRRRCHCREDSAARGALDGLLADPAGPFTSKNGCNHGHMFQKMMRQAANKDTTGRADTARLIAEAVFSTTGYNGTAAVRDLLQTTLAALDGANRQVGLLN